MGEDDYGFEGFEGIEEAPLPDVFGDDMSADPLFSPPVEEPPKRPNYDAASASGARMGKTQKMRQGYSQPGQSIDSQDDFSFDESDMEPEPEPMEASAPVPPPVQQRPQQRRQPMQQGQASGAAGGQQARRPAQRHPAPQQQGQMQGQQPMQGQQMQGQPIQQANIQQGFGGQGRGRQKQPKQQKQQRPPKQPPNNGGNNQKKGLPIIPIIVGVVVLIVVLLVVLKATGIIGKQEPLEPAIQNYETSGRFALDKLLSGLNEYNAVEMDSIVGTEDGDSYLAQEWAYVNGVKIRQEFLQTVGALVKFEYPLVQQYSTTGVPMTDEMGNPIMIKSQMNNNEEFTVTIPDWSVLVRTMDEKSDYILRLLNSSGYKPEDYTYPDELTNLMLQFILDDGEIPTTQAQIQLSVRLGLGGQPYIESDAVLDDLLFGSDDFRAMAAKFSQICTGWTGYIEETYLTYERKHNEEYDRWLELFLAYFEADGGKYDPDGDPQFTHVRESFNSRTSKWEPWYLRDENNVIQKYPDGSYIVNYFTVKDANGNDWIQPAEEIEYEVENTRQLDDPWIEETGIWYNWLGCHWLQTQYKGKGDIVTRVGDGSRDFPAGIGTTIITKVLGTDGKYHDVKVALLGYWTGQSAIDYAEKFSTRNRGFTASSVIQLICFEVSVENLEKEPFSFESSEMTLTDKNGNITSRTGTMYEFTEIVTLEGANNRYGGQKVILNDWATSTELNQKYVCWGKSFGRQFSMVYFDALAGTGDIPSYSAYEQFTGKSALNDAVT